MRAAGIDFAALRPGTRLRIGDVLCETTLPAVPCTKNARWNVTTFCSSMRVVSWKGSRSGISFHLKRGVPMSTVIEAALSTLTSSTPASVSNFMRDLPVAVLTRRWRSTEPVTNTPAPLPVEPSVPPA